MTLVRLLLLFSLLLPALAARAGGDDVHVFWHDGCPHCAKLLAFLDRAQAEDATLRVHRYHVDTRAGQRLFVATAQALGATPNAVPFTVVGSDSFTGYYDDASTGEAILATVQRCRSTGCPDTVLAVQRGTLAGGTATGTATGNAHRALPETLQLPLIGEIHTAQLSLPLLTVTLAAIDGFNPCAMWALVFLLGLLVGLKDRRRMWLLGGTFVVTSALVYFLFMTAWLNLVLFIGAVGWLRVAIGLLALAGGSWYLYERKTRRDETCQVSAVPARRRVLDGLRALSQREQLTFALLGIMALAFVVNLIELVCSAGIPAVYTQVLAMTPMSTAQHYGYLALYILVFMLDDLFVLAAALFTLQVTGISGRYTHAATLVGAVVLLTLGLVMIFRPQWLMFG